MKISSCVFVFGLYANCVPNSGIGSLLERTVPVS